MSHVTDATIGMPSLKSYLDLEVKGRTLGPSVRVDQSIPSTNTQISVLMLPKQESPPTQ